MPDSALSANAIVRRQLMIAARMMDSYVRCRPNMSDTERRSMIVVSRSLTRLVAAMDTNSRLSPETQAFLAALRRVAIARRKGWAHD